MMHELEFHVVAYLAQRQEGYGWKIKDWLAQVHALDVPVTSIYRILTRLEEEKLLQFRHGEPGDQLAGGLRKYYRLTESAKSQLPKLQREMQETSARIAKSAAIIAAISQRCSNSGG